MLTGGHEPWREGSPYLHSVVLQVDPGLLCLLLLQELIGLDPSLPGLFRFWPAEPHLKERIYLLYISTCTLSQRAGIHRDGLGLLLGLVLGGITTCRRDTQIQLINDPGPVMGDPDSGFRRLI